LSQAELASQVFVSSRRLGFFAGKKTQKLATLRLIGGAALAVRRLAANGGSEAYGTPESGICRGLRKPFAGAFRPNSDS